MATIQQELKPQPTPDDDMDEMYEEEPRRRAWGAIASVILALALVFVGYQWNQAATHAEALGAQVSGLRAEAETQRLRAEDAQRQVDMVQKRLAALAAEKESLADRVVALEKASSARAAGGDKAKTTKATTTAAAEKPKPAKSTVAAPARPKATPVAATKRTP
jgi:chromosome segregation ATPase